MSCDVGKAMEGLENELWCSLGEVTERLENELCYDYNYELCSFSNLSITSPTSQLILQPFRRFTYVTAHSPTLPLFHLRHSSFSNPSFASPRSQGLHLIHLANRPWSTLVSQGSFQIFYGLFMCFVWQPTPNSLFVAATDYRTLFCFDSARHSY